MRYDENTAGAKKYLKNLVGLGAGLLDAPQHLIALTP
jgi:hypothetical protein